MAHWCDSCGQPLPEGDVPNDATWLGAPDSTGQSTAMPVRAKRSGSEKKLLLVVAGMVAVWGAFVGLGRLTAPDDVIDEQAAAEIEAARIERQADAAADAAATNAAAEVERAAAEARAAATEPEPEPESEPPPIEAIGQAEGDETSVEHASDEASPSDDRAVNTLQVERLQRQLIRRDVRPFVAYRSAGGVVVIDLVNGAATTTELEPGAAVVRPGSRLLRSGSSTYAVDPETTLVQRVGEDSSLVVSDTLDGNTYFVDAKTLAGQASIVEVVAAGTYGFHRMPAGGFQLLPVDGLGLLAVPKGPTGETLIAGVDDFGVLSENRVLTGTSQALLEQVCSSDESCSLALHDIATGERTPIPASFVRFGDHYVVAPDGRSLLRYSPEGFAEVFVADDDSISWVTGAGMRAPAWGPNSDLIVWIDRIGDPTLKVMFPGERDWLSIALHDLGAPPPASSDLIVFATNPPSAESG